MLHIKEELKFIKENAALKYGAICLILTTLLDGLLTIKLINRFGTEMELNPLISFLIDVFGVNFALIYFKLGIATFGVLVAYLIFQKSREYLLFGYLILFGGSFYYMVGILLNMYALMI